MITAAIFGAGAMGSVHARNAAQHPGISLKYICSPMPDKGTDLARELGASFVKDADTVYNDPEVDLIVLAYPTHVRFEVLQPALAAGKYVLCEKPFAHNIEEAKKIRDCDVGARTWISTGMVLRYFWEYKTAHDIIESGRLGRVGTVRTTRVCSFPRGWNNWFADFNHSGGVILDLALHDIDFLQWTFGAVSRVYAKGMRFAGINEKDYALITLKFQSGVIAHVEGSWIEQPGTFYTALEVAAEKGMLEHDMRKVSPLVFTPLIAQPGKPQAVVIPEMPVLESPYMTELRAVVDAIESGGAAPVPISKVFPALEIAEAALTSIRTGEPVTLSSKGDA